MNPAKYSVLLLLCLFLSASVYGINASDGGHTAYATIKIEGLTAAQGDDITKLIRETSGVTLEYSCTVSDIVILRYEKSPFANEADVINYFKGLLNSGKHKYTMSFLSVTVVKEFDSERC